MNIQFWLLAGAVLGWLVSLVLRRSPSAQLFNVIVGIVGAIVTGSLLAPLFRVSTIRTGTFNLPALMISLGGAVLLLAVVNIFSNENDVKQSVIERRWEQVSNKISTRWRKLTKEDVAEMDGSYDRFIATIQARYGITEKETRFQIQRYLKAVLVGGSRRSFMYDHTQTANL